MTSGDLADLIGQTKGDRSYAKLAQESGDVVIRQRWYQLATSPLKEFPEPPTIEAIARGLGVSVTDVVIACSRSVGLHVRDAGTFAGLDLAGVPDEQAEAVRRLVSTLRTEREENDRGNTAPIADENAQPRPKLAHARRERIDPVPPTAAELAGEGDNVHDLAADEEGDSTGP